MRKALILLAFGLFMSDVASAEKIDKGEAYRIASEFFGGGAGRRMAPAAGGDATLRLAAEGDIEVYTSAGVLLHRQKGSQADLSGLAPGLYIVKEGGTVRKVAKR